MEGLVLSTAFISFAILAWLVIAKFGGGSDSNPGSGCSDSDETASGLDRQSGSEKAGGESGMVDGGDASATVDMRDEAVQIEAAAVHRSTLDKRLSTAIDDVGEDSSGVGTPSSSRRLSRRQRKNNRRREKEEKDKANPRKFFDAGNTRSESSSSRSGFPATCLELPIAAASSTSPSATAFSSGAKNKKRSGVPCRQYEKLGLQDFEIYQCLMNYKLEEDQMRRLGFPMESELHPGKACVYQDPEFGSRSLGEVDDDDYRDDEHRSRIGSRSSSLLDVNAREFYPSGGNSGKSPPQQQLQVASVTPTAVSNANEAEVEAKNVASPTAADSDQPKTVKSEDATSTLTAATFLQHSTSTSSVLSATAKEFVPSFLQKTEIPATSSGLENPDRAAFFVGEGVEMKQCARCNKIFYVTSEGLCLTKEGCTYHWGKLRAKKRWPADDDRFTCCGAPASEATRGCCTCRVHVWRNLTEPGMHAPLDGFVRTKTRKCYPPDGNYGIYSLDGEMCFTTNGLELIKLTVVGVEGRLVYETLVVPEGEILDYNTRFSGISARDLKRGPSKSLREVQNDVMGFVSAHTILIGHGLENDLRALKLVHTTIIDTSIVFPHYFGLPYRRSLKSLVKSYLKRDIQAASWGHDSYEDARACVELMLWKVQCDLPMFGAKSDDDDNSHQAGGFFSDFVHVDQFSI